MAVVVVMTVVAMVVIRRVPEAKVLKDVSYNEAMELAYFGAKVRATCRRQRRRLALHAQEKGEGGRRGGRLTWWLVGRCCR